MAMIQVQLPEPIQQVIDRQVAAGRVASQDEFLIEAARRLDEDIDLEDEVVAEAESGIADAEAGHFVTIATPEDAAALHERAMLRLHSRMTAGRGWCPTGLSVTRGTGSTPSCSTAPGVGA